MLLFIDKGIIKLNKDFVLFITYTAPENAPIYEANSTNGTDILNEKLPSVMSDELRVYYSGWSKC